MAELVRIKLADGTLVSHTREWAESFGLKVLDDQRGADARGGALDPKYPVDLRGKELDAALSAAGLPTSGTAAEKRERLADHQSSTGNPPAGPTEDEETR